MGNLLQTDQVSIAIDQFNRDGYIFLENVLSDALLEELKKGVITAFNTSNRGYAPIFRGMMFERGRAFEELIDLSPVIELVEEILGPYCHIRSMNAIKTSKRTGIDQWHVDLVENELFFPIAHDLEYDKKIRIPVFIVNVLYYLVDVDENMGPTQIIPTSHRSGRVPDFNNGEIEYKGHKPIIFTAKAGDCLLFNNQVWHKGGINHTENPRLVQQVVYSKKFISQQYYPYLEYRLPDELVSRSSEKRKRLLGLHNRDFV